MVAILEGGGAYGFKTVNPDPRKGEASCPVSDALQLMLAFGGFILGILTFVVLLIEKISKKNNHLILIHCLYKTVLLFKLFLFKGVYH
jgi:hypothetical protein